MNPVAVRSLVFLLLVSLTGCSVAAPPPTATPVPTSRPTSTATTAPTATSTPAPTETRFPTATFEPAPPHDAAAVEAVLRSEGYKRFPIGEDAWFWDSGSDIVFRTYPFGLEAAFLNDPGAQAGRLELMDQALDIVAPLFTEQFIADLKEESHTYADRVITVSGDARILDDGNGGSLGKLMQFNPHQTSVQNGPDLLPIEHSLLFREYNCDPGYICRFVDAPSMTFTGGATLTFFNIWIEYEPE